MNRSLFSALWLEKMAISLTIGLIVMVAALNIVASLILLVMEKHRDIAILKTMGASARSITTIFMLQGLDHRRRRHGGGGVRWGIGVCDVLDRYKLIRVPVDVYQISTCRSRSCRSISRWSCWRRCGGFRRDDLSLAAGAELDPPRRCDMSRSRWLPLATHSDRQLATTWLSSKRAASSRATRSAERPHGAARSRRGRGAGRDGRHHGRVGRRQEYVAPCSGRARSGRAGAVIVATRN